MRIEELYGLYEERKTMIKKRLLEFETVWRDGDDLRIFEELAFCILTAGASARMGLRCIDSIRPILITGTEEEIFERIRSIHIYPQARARYIVQTREYLKDKIGLRLKEAIGSFQDRLKRRDFLAMDKGIKGIGFKEASHFLRNIGFKGYAILDRHIIKALGDFGIVDSDKPPSSRSRYIEIEERMRRFSEEIGIDMDELDLLLWSARTGEVLK
jgi:N-glycosylase/DNA lyase